MKKIFILFFGIFFSCAPSEQEKVKTKYMDSLRTVLTDFQKRRDSVEKILQTRHRELTEYQINFIRKLSDSTIHRKEAELQLLNELSIEASMKHIDSAIRAQRIIKHKEDSILRDLEELKKETLEELKK